MWGLKVLYGVVRCFIFSIFSNCWSYLVRSCSLGWSLIMKDQKLQFFMCSLSTQRKSVVVLQCIRLSHFAILDKGIGDMCFQKIEMHSVASRSCFLFILTMSKTRNKLSFFVGACDLMLTHFEICLLCFFLKWFDDILRGILLLFRLMWFLFLLAIVTIVTLTP